MRAPFSFPRVQVVPGVDGAEFLVDGAPRARYDFGRDAKRPFVFPLRGPSGAMLTRLGHPNPVGHEHHHSIWFGHQKIQDVNFWEERETNDIGLRHRRVTMYHDGDAFGGLVAEIDWWANGRSLMKQTLVIALEPIAGARGEYHLDLQSRFETTGGPILLGKTNFGFLGVRVAKTMSEQFGGGRLLNDKGDEGEKALFARTSRWVDYSGPTRPDVVEGICYLDHPSNPHHPSPWHVRQDGWMEAAFNLEREHGIASGHPLDLRYRLLVHSGRGSVDVFDKAWSDYARTPAYEIVPIRGNELGQLRRGAGG